MPVACLLATRTTWNELKSWQEKFLITTWLADWHACSSSSMAANGGQQVCVPSTSDLGGAGTVAMRGGGGGGGSGGNSLHPTNFLYLASVS